MSTDRFVIRTIALALATSVVVGVCVMGALAAVETPIPDQFDRIITYLAGVLSGFLISTKSHGEEDPPQTVTVVNPPADPIPTTDVKTTSRSKP